MTSSSTNKMAAATTHESHNSSMPLASRLDHLDFIMKYLERKQSLAKMGGNGSSAAARVLKSRKPCLPMDLALKETYFKGSLLDRVAGLEHRLFQLCLEMESSSSSCNSKQASGDAYWSRGSKGESSSSFPTFSTNPHPRHGQNKWLSQVHATRLEIEEQQDREHPKQKPQSTCPAQQRLRKKNRTNNDEKSCENGKKKISSNWPYLKLLGC